MSIRDKLRKVAVRPVEVDGDTFYVRRLTGVALGKLAEMPQGSQSELLEVMNFVAASCLCDVDGSRVFSWEDDRHAITEIDATVVRTIAEAAFDFSGLSTDAQEDIKKKLGTTATSNSGVSLDSPFTSQTFEDSNGESTPTTSPSGEPITSMTPGEVTGAELPS